MNTVILQCENCGKIIERRAAEAKRCAKRGFKTVCSRSCGATLANTGKPNKNKNWAKYLKCGSESNDLSPFRYFVNKAKCADRTTRYGQQDLTLEYLKSLWEKQDGICPYTKHKMLLPHNTAEMDKLRSPYRASLDRIDSSIGYIQGNVEFVCLSVNYAKSHFSTQEIKQFFVSINQPKV